MGFEIQSRKSNLYVVCLLERLYGHLNEQSFKSLRNVLHDSWGYYLCSSCFISYVKSSQHVIDWFSVFCLRFSINASHIRFQAHTAGASQIVGLHFTAYRIKSLFHLCVSDWPQYLQPSYLIDTFPPHNHFSIHLNQIVTLKMEAALSSKRSLHVYRPSLCVMVKLSTA
jgi:hypothetical protein